MSLVFFDIECASVYKYSAKICAFGYVLCDEQFNIIEKNDVLINPKGRFHLTDCRGENGIVLPYEYGEFKNYPKFPQVFPKIKALLEDKNNLVFGHATLNDVKYLNLETNRFRLPPFDFEFSDSQLMYMTSVNDFSRQFGLEYITEKLNVEFTPHRAADDAYATMRVVEALCKKYDCTCRQLEKILKIRHGRIKNHRITKPTSQAFMQFVEQKERDKKERSARRSKFFIAISRMKSAKSGAMRGKKVMFSRPLEENTEVSVSLAELIYSLGGRYAQKLDECDYYVCEQEDGTVRTQNAVKAQNIIILSPQGVKELVND